MKVLHKVKQLLQFVLRGDSLRPRSKPKNSRQKLAGKRSMRLAKMPFLGFAVAATAIVLSVLGLAFSNGAAYAGDYAFGANRSVSVTLGTSSGPNTQDVECPPGRFISAIAVSHGNASYITELQMWCQAPRPDKSAAERDASSETNLVVVNSGAGGTRFFRSCATSEFLAGFIAADGTGFVHELSVVCRNILSQADSEPHGFGRGSVTDREKCGAGEFMTGLTASTGAGVDKIMTIKCRTLSYTLSTPSVSNVVDNGASLTVTVGNLDTMAGTRYRVRVYDGADTSNTTVIAEAANQSSGTVTVSGAGIYCGRAYRVTAEATGISGGNGTFDKASGVSATFIRTADAVDSCAVTTLTISSNPTSNVRLNTTGPYAGFFQAITKNTTGNLNVAELKSAWQQGYVSFSATNLDWQASAPLTLDSSTTCGRVDASFQGTINLASAINSSACTNGSTGFGNISLNGTSVTTTSGAAITARSVTLRSTAPSGAIQIGGQVNATSASTFEAQGASGTLVVGAQITAPTISLTSQKLQLNAALSSSTRVSILPRTANTAIDLGSATDVAANTLEISDAELDRISTTTLRIGNATSGNITVSDAISPATAPTLSLVTAGSVSRSGSGSISVPNLGIQAAGAIDLSNNNSVTGNLALNTSGAVTYNQTVGIFTPASVDGITAQYGIPSKVNLADVPSVGSSVDASMNINFNPPPVATLLDRFDRPLLPSNIRSTGYTITATKATGPGALSGTTSRTTASGGVATFDNLRVITDAGSHTVTFTATAISPATIVGTPSATTGTYNVKAPQTITFTQMTNRTLGSSNSFTVSATSNRGLTVAFSGDPTTSAVCTVSGTTVSMVTAGTCRIFADQAGDSSNDPAPRVQRQFEISSALVLTTPSSGLTGTFNSPYTLTLSRTGGASPYTFDVSVGTLPSGLTVESSTGVIRGTPSAASTQTVTLRVTDANGAVATTSAFTLTINRETLATPTAPTVAPSTSSLKRLDVSWSAVPNASSYVVKLYDSTGTGDALATVSVISATSRTLTTSDYPSFADLTAYTVSVQAIGLSNYQDSAESAKTSARTRGLPESITVDTAGVVDATGVWISGTWYTASTGTSRVTPTALQNQMNAANATLQTAGSITVSSAVASPNAARSLSLTSTGDNVTVNAAISGVSAMTVRCNSGTFRNGASGSITTNDDVLIECGSIETTGAISSGSDVKIESTNNNSSASARISGDVMSRATNSLVTIKAANTVLIRSVTIQTPGSSSPELGGISLWADSNGDNIGSLQTLTSCINTIGSCSSPSNTGGARIVLGGDTAADATGNFPTGGVASSASTVGIALGTSTPGPKIWSGGGDISVTSVSAGTAVYSGQFWSGRSFAHSGNGQLKLLNIGENPSSTVEQYGIYFTTGQTGAGLEPVTLTSNRSTGRAIEMISDNKGTNDWAVGIRSFVSTTTIRTTIQAPSGGEIYMEGTTAGVHSMEFSNTDIVASTGNLTMRGNKSLYLDAYSSSSVNIGATASGSASGNILLEFGRQLWGGTGGTSAYRTTGELTFRPFDTSFIVPTHFPITNQTLSSQISGLTVGSTTNTQTINIRSNVNIAGPITYRTGNLNLFSSVTSTSNSDVAFYSTGSISQDQSISSAGSLVMSATSVRVGGTINASQVINILSPSVTVDRNVISSSGVSVVTNRLTLAATIGTTSSSGVVTIAPHSNGTVIDLGTEVSDRLSLTTSEVNRISAGTLRIGALNGTNSGNINITEAIAPTGVATLALRTSGTVQSSGSGSITEVNLAISASVINLGGNNSITGNLALSSSGATLTYNQMAGSFTPATVDQVTPEYGIATAITMSQVPTSTAVDRMMAVAFNPPPLVTLKDKFGNDLTTANTQSTSYTVTATKAFGSGNVTGTTATTTSTRGVARFDNLRVSDVAGVHRITFTATVTATSAQISGTPSATTGDYNIQLDQTISFTSTAPAAARASGAAYTPTATSSSALAVTITVDASASAVCSISSGIVSFLAVGTCVLNANQAGNSTFSPAQQVQQSFTVAEAKLGTPNAPTVTATSNTLKSLEVSWLAVTDAVTYTLKIYPAPGTGSASAIVVGITETSKRITASEFPQIADGTQYFLSVTAIASTSEGNSNESMKTSATTNSPAVAPTITSQPLGASRTAGQSVTFTSTASRTDAGVLSFQWRKDGTNIAGATSSTLTRNSLATGDAGSYTVVVTNSLNGSTNITTSNEAVLTVAPALLITTPSSGLAATVNSAYTLTLAASGGSTPRTFATSSTLPTGITLSSAGVLSGTPTQSGTFAITAVVTDANGATASTGSFNLVVAAAPGLVATFATPVSAVSGQTDRLTVQITNYDPAYTWSGTASVGTVSVSNTGLVTFSGVSSGQTTSATITASRLHYLNATSNVSATMAAMPRISYNSSDLNSYATDSVVRDLSGRGNNGSAINEIGIVSTSGAWRFTGGTNANGDYIDLPDLATNSFSSGITVDFEADFGAITESERIIDLGTAFGSISNNLYIARKNNTNHLHAVITRSGAVFECLAENVIPNSGLNRWTVSFSGSVCVILRNSVEVARVSNPNFSLNSNQTLVSNFIGRSNISSAVQFEGQIRSLRIFAGTPSFAQIGAIPYKTVSYDSNGGSAVAATARGTTSGELLLADAPNRTGFTFTGWYDSTDTLTRTKIGDAGARYAPSADIQLFAGWEATTLTVTFNSNSGTAVSSGTTRAGEDLVSPTNPTRTGYTFAGWFAQSDLSGTQITFPYAHGRDVNFTLYAKWTANAFDVTFGTNSGTAVTAFTTRTAEALPNSFTTTRAGYTFAGWFDNIGRTGSPIVFPFAHTNTEAFTLYADWTANDLNVSLVTNGGSAVTTVVTRTGDSISSAPAAPTRAGYNFVGWFDNEALNGSAISFPYAHGKTANFTLYAKWEAKTLTVSFNSGGGSSVSSITTQTAATITSAPTPPTRAGYNFLGWVENGDLSGTVISFPYTHGKTADFTLYATWDANTLTVSFNTNSGAAVTAVTTRTGDVISATITTTRTGYAFAGWFDNEGLTGSAVTFPYTHGKTASFTLFAKWTPNTLNVTFDTNSGIAVTATTTRTGEPLTGTFTTTRAGYTFAGWFSNVGLTGSPASFPYTHGQTANFMLYAKWTANTLNVRFERNDASGNFLTGTTITGGEINPPATDPTYRGFEFLGWSETQNGSILSFPYVHGRTADFTLHAVWKAGNYTVIYQYNGASGANSVASQAYTTDIARTGLVLPVPTRTGFTFAGWFSDISLATALVLEGNGRYVPTANQTVYAKWTAIDYTVTYNSTDATTGSVPVDSRLYNIGQTVSLLSNSGLLVRTGYTFAGWVTSPTGQGSELNSGQTVTVGAANINFYPKWTPRTYSISYNLNGGTGSFTGAPTSWTVGTSNVTLPSAGITRTGYDFGGWARTAGGSAVSNSFSNNFVDETLTAIWTLKNISYTFAPGAASSSGITRWPANASSTFGSEVTLPDLNGEVVTILGSSYLFFGWGDGSATYRSGQKFILTETSPQFTAQWVKLLDVRYSFGGGTKSVNDTESNDGDAECVTNLLCAPNQVITLRGAPTRLGYSFVGWKAQTTSETIIRQAGTTTVIRNDNYLFFAEWTPVDYNFSFNSVGGSINNGNVTGNIGRVLTLPSPGTRTGYTFGGWSPDLGATTFAAGPTYVIGSASIGFEAVWIPDVYQISFDWQGGVGTPQPNTSFTVGRGPMVLPGLGDRVKDGFSFAGWSTTSGGEVVSNYEPTANGVLFAKWVDGNYTLSFNAQNGPTPVTQALVARAASTTLPTPTRSNFRFVGWFDALTGGNFVGGAGATYQPTASKTLYARWVQSSFYGVDEAALEVATTYTASSSQSVDTTITHNPSGSQARIQIPAGTLPDGTVVSVRYFKDDTRQRDLIGNTNNYFFSVIVSWLLGSGATATVPDTLFANGVQKPITVTLTNSQIKAGAMVYRVLDGVVTPLERATVDGSVTIRIFTDPELVVAATPPTAPRNLLVVGPGRGTSSVSWLAPESNGGSPITNYDVFLDGVLACGSITILSCDLTNLSDSNTYNVRVIAKNAVGNGTEAITSFTTSAPVSSSSGDGASAPTPGPVVPVKPVDPSLPLVPVKPVAPVAPVNPAPTPTPSPETSTPTPTAPPAPVEPVNPKPETNASGEQTPSSDLSWLLWLLALGAAGAILFGARANARKSRR